MEAGSQSFLRTFLRDPRGIGAMTPATRSLARAVASATHRAYHRHVSIHTPKLIELGAGTGALTREISGLNPILVEKEATWASLLGTRFPTLEVRHECATATLRTVHEPIGLVTSIPLLNNPQAEELKRLLAAKYEEGLIKFCVFYTYGWTNPLNEVGFRESRRMQFVARSWPPAHVWACQ